MSDERIEKEWDVDYFYVLEGVDPERLRGIAELRHPLGICGFSSEIECPYRATPVVFSRSWEPAKSSMLRYLRPFSDLQSGRLLSGMPDPERIRRLAGLGGLGSISSSAGESLRSASDAYLAAARSQLERESEAAEKSGNDVGGDSADDEQLAEIRAALNESRQLGERAQQGIDALVERAS